VQASLYTGLTELPAFIPDEDSPPPATVEALRRELAGADAVVFCTPEYAGSLPGSLKNLLDWTVGSGELYGKPVAWINVAAEGRGTGAEATMATVLGYVGADIITQACARVPVARDTIAEDGTVRSDELRARFAQIVAAIVEYLDQAAGE
jgi:chromate reductase